MSDETYKTIHSPSSGVFKCKRSEFYAFAYPVKTEDEIRNIRHSLHKRYYDARHYVYAFRLGYDAGICRASDDGEPHNSSGPAVLSQIKSYDLTDILIVVVRYFGGKKLGIPGLINAYKTAAELTVKNAEIIEKTIEKTASINFNYSKMNAVMKIIKNENLRISKIDNKEKCFITLSVKESAFERIKEQFKALDIFV